MQPRTPSLLDGPYIMQTHLVSQKGHKRVKLKRKDESTAVIKKGKNLCKRRISGYSSEAPDRIFHIQRCSVLTTRGLDLLLGSNLTADQ